VITYRAAPKPTKREKCFFPLGAPFAFSTSASARGLCFRKHCDRLEILPLRGTFISGLQPWVCNLSFSKFSESPARSENQRQTVFHLLEKLIGVIKNGTE